MIKRVFAAMALSLTIILTACSPDGISIVDHEKPVFSHSNEISVENMMKNAEALAGKDDARTTGTDNEKAAAVYIMKQFESMGFEIKTQAFDTGLYRTANSDGKSAKSQNIIAELKAEGGGKNPVTLVLGAHYDSVNTPGANDNASGVIVLLEVARIMSKQKLPCNVTFIAFGAEEFGMVGSRFYVENLSKAEKNKIKGMISLDVVGTGTDLIVFTGEGKEDNSMSEMLKSCAKSFGYSCNSIDPPGGSDHIPFYDADIPALCLSGSPFNKIHTDEDKTDALDRVILKKVVEVTCEVCLNFKYKE